MKVIMNHHLHDANQEAAMITVNKKRGNKQPFDPEKIKTGINNAARDAEIIITDKEAELMTTDVERHIISLRGINGTTSTYEIRQLVRLVLQEFGYPQIVQSFERGRYKNMSDIERHRKAIAEHQAALDELLQEEGAFDFHEDRDAAPQDMVETEPVKEPEIDYKFRNMRTEHYKNREK